jgi:hypothetical protein
LLDGVLVNNISSTYQRILDGEDKQLFNEVMAWKNLKINRGL